MAPRVGIIGGGVFGTKMLKAYSAAERMGLVELAAIADINEETLKSQSEHFGIEGYLDYKQMFEKAKLDAVAIVTPDFLHKKMAVEAANFGLHILVEKPIDVSSNGALEMIAAARENQVMLYVDFHKRLDPGHLQLKQDIRSGKLGKIQYGYAWMEDQIVVPSVWFKNWAQNSSPAWFLGIHFIDLIYWLVESEPKRVYATGIKDKLARMGIDSYDSVQSKIEFENGSSFAVDSSWIIPNSFPSIVNQGIKVVGSDGIWEVDSQDRGTAFATAAESGATVPNYYAGFERQHPLYGLTPQGYINESMYFFLQLLNALKCGTKLEELQGTYPSGEEALVSTRICEAIHLSVQNGQIIDL